MRPGIERIGSEAIYEAKVASLRVDRLRHDDRSEAAERELVGHSGAVAVVAHADRSVHLVHQPREAALGEALLELPVGKLFVEGETPLLRCVGVVPCGHVSGMRQ